MGVTVNVHLLYVYDMSLTHHSDRGAQYCSKDYVDLLVGETVSISMT
ncbi:transposase InsO family protein, partial [Mucilaginibacter dorajii]|nr:transposase InsO family protein [Mucilaginibacter dorajii]